MQLYVSYIYQGGPNGISYGSGFYQCSQLDEVSAKVLKMEIEKATFRKDVMVLAWSEPQAAWIDGNAALGYNDIVGRTFVESSPDGEPLFSVDLTKALFTPSENNLAFGRNAENEEV